VRDEGARPAGVIDLDDPEATSPGIAGAKAARLAAARRAGLPTLPGVVLTADASFGPLRRAEAVAASSGTASARLALSSELVGAELEDRASAAFGSDPLVARSSSPLEADGGWSGAFTSYIDIAAGELVTAVRGCWASMFSRDASERFDVLDLVPSDAGMAVLVQPRIVPEPGGVAVVDERGVEVTIAERSLSGMLLGWEKGVVAFEERGGTIRGPALERFAPTLVASVARVARDCAAATGDNHLEWACVDGEVLILQCRRVAVASREVGADRRPADTTFAGAVAARAGRLVSRYGGAAGEALVLSWALAPHASGTRHDPGRSAASPVALAPAVAVAERLAARAWRRGGPEAIAEARRVLEVLRTPLVASALEELAGLDAVDSSDGERLIAGVEALGSRLVASGCLADPSDVWRLGLADLAAHLEGRGTLARPRSGPVAPDPWEPFLLETIWANGTWRAGAPASDGEGAGRVLCIDAPRRLTGSLQRYVLYVDLPHPGYAPLLWGAAALVAAGGDPSAHLFDVARSLGVPAVAGSEHPEWSALEHVVAAVDGSAGVVAYI